MHIFTLAEWNDEAEYTEISSEVGAGLMPNTLLCEGYGYFLEDTQWSTIKKKTNVCDTFFSMLIYNDLRIII